MNGSYGLIAEQGFYSILAAIAFVVVAILIGVLTNKHA